MFFRAPHYSQPVGEPFLDRSNPLAETITHCLPLDGLNREIVTGAVLTLGTGGSWVDDTTGKVLKGSGSAAGASVPIDLSPWNKLTISFDLWWDAYASDDDLAMEFTANTNSNNGGWSMDPNTASGAIGFYTRFTSSSNGKSSGVVRPSAAAWHRYNVTIDRTVYTGNSFNVRIDGRPVTVTMGLNEIGDGTNFPNSTLYLFSRGGTTLYGAGRLRNLAIRGGYLMSDDEALREALDPYQIYAKVSRTISLGTTSAAALAGNATATATAAGTLTTAIPLTGAALGVATASGALSAPIALDGAALAVATAAGTLTAQITLNGAALAQALASAALSSGIVLTAAAVAQAAADGTLTTAIQLIGAAGGIASASGNLTGGSSAIALDGAATGQATAAGTLTAQIRFSGAALGVASASGDLTVSVPLTGAALAEAIVSGSLTTEIRLSGAAVGVARASGNLTGGSSVVSLAPDPRYIAHAAAVERVARAVARDYTARIH